MLRQLCWACCNYGKEGAIFDAYPAVILLWRFLPLVLGGHPAKKITLLDWYSVDSKKSKHLGTFYFINWIVAAETIQGKKLFTAIWYAPIFKFSYDSVGPKGLSVLLLVIIYTLIIAFEYWHNPSKTKFHVLLLPCQQLEGQWNMRNTRFGILFFEYPQILKNKC